MLFSINHPHMLILHCYTFDDRIGETVWVKVIVWVKNGELWIQLVTCCGGLGIAIL